MMDREEKFRITIVFSTQYECVAVLQKENVLGGIGDEGTPTSGASVYTDALLASL